MPGDIEQPPQSLWSALLKENNFNIDKSWQAWLKIRQQGSNELR
jgi:hypothetical protein